MDPRVAYDTHKVLEAIRPADHYPWGCIVVQIDLDTPQIVASIASLITSQLLDLIFMQPGPGCERQRH